MPKLDITSADEPNTTTRAAMDAANNGDMFRAFDSVSDLMEALNAYDDLMQEIEKGAASEFVGEEEAYKLLEITKENVGNICNNR